MISILMLIDFGKQSISTWHLVHPICDKPNIPKGVSRTNLLSFHCGSPRKSCSPMDKAEMQSGTWSPVPLAGGMRGGGQRSRKGILSS